MGIKAYIGIDPGKSGAACLLTETGRYIFFDWPSKDDLFNVLKKIRQWNDYYDIQLAAIELVNCGAVQGRKSAFTFGNNFGHWEMLLMALGIPHVKPRPSEWQKGLVIKTDSKDVKTRALMAVRRIYTAKIDRMLTKPKGKKILDGRVDALLIANYAKRWKEMGS
ncbi:hypothetical protein LCGC14_0957480 [marine sediment metagenome]|uniref:Uncharacterized protein n=1 Tax=marine sediment metagenome TaxID=412755 RepID=A0A0F9NK41_9ZZZZ